MESHIDAVLERVDDYNLIESVLHMPPLWLKQLLDIYFLKKPIQKRRIWQQNLVLQMK